LTDFFLGCGPSQGGSPQECIEVLWRLTTLLIATWIAVLCEGCVDQQKDVSRYRRILENDGTPQLPAIPQEAPLTLQHALRLANQHNEQLASSGEDYVQALIDKDRAFSGFLPTVALSPTFSMVDRSEIDKPSLKETTLKAARSGAINSVTKTIAGAMPGTVAGSMAGGVVTAVGSALGGGSSNSSASMGGAFQGYRVNGDVLERMSAPANLKINLFNGFRDEASLRAAIADINQRENLLLDSQETILLQVAMTYYQVLRSQALVDVLRNSLNVQEERLRDIRGRYTAGVARPLDVAQTEAQVANTRGSLVRAESDVNNGRTTLAFLIGVPSVEGPLSDEFTSPEKLDSIDAYEKEADESRRDLQAAHSMVVVAKARVDVAVGQYYPSISINLNAFMYDENFANASKWNGLISANFPLFSAGLIEADVRTAFSQLRQALLNESMIRRQVHQDVRTAHENVEASRKLIRNLEIQVAAASQAYHLAEQNYSVGFATNLERLTALDQLLSAQLQMASETYFQKFYYLQLLRMTGRLREDVLDVPTTTPAAETVPASAPPTYTAGQ